MLTVLEAVEAEHPGRNWRRAPLALLFVYYAAISARWGNEPNGPTFVDLDQVAGFRKQQRARKAQGVK